MEQGDPFAPFAGSINLVNVRVLHLNSIMCRTSPAPLVSVLPRLEELRCHFCMTANTEGLLGLGNLTHLHTLELAGLDDTPLDELAANPALGQLCKLSLNAPSLSEALDLDMGGGMLRLADLRPVFRSQHLANLKELAINFSYLGDAGCAEIVSSGLLGRLEYLDLSFNEITDEGVTILTRCPDFPRLRKLRMDGNLLTRAGIQRLQNTGVQLTTRWQQETLENW